MIQTRPNDGSGVPFSFFCSLLHEISQIPPHKTALVTRDRAGGLNYPAARIFNRWIIQLHKLFSPIPPGTTSVVFRMLFPEEDTRRKYDMQEARLAQALAECLGIYALPQLFSDGSSGCLGEELKLLLERNFPTVDGHVGSLTISDVDSLLDELASASGFSHASVRRMYPRKIRRARQLILKDLFRPLPPIDASFLTQIILKDTRPLLYPLQETHYTMALLNYNTTSITMLRKEHAMIAWDPSGWMLKTYYVRSTLDEAANSFELPLRQRPANLPRIGTPVEIPKSEKGRSCRHALEFFRHSTTVWAETKYDGERAQIHVEILPDGKSRIIIFSKSKRDSSMDRRAVHDIIREALGLSNMKPRKSTSSIKQNVILDAEMVACRGTNIDEFWRIRGLVEQSAYGVRRIWNKARTTPDSHPQTPITTNTRHLALVFFDVLVVDSTSLLSTPYSRRREILESLIQFIPGQSMLSHRIPIAMCSNEEDNNAQTSLEKIFADAIVDHQEGIMLKAGEARYHDYKLPWVKLKKDYIPGYGDTLDLVIVAAGWDKARARELRVPPTTLTTLYVGVLSNAQDIDQCDTILPHFQVYFTVSYGLNRHQLEEVNFLLKSSDSVSYTPKAKLSSLAYSFTMLPDLPKPSIILKTPLLAELFGAGFTKSPPSKYYELRFPRVTKIYRMGERGWKDGVNLQQLHKIACEVVGHNSSDNEIDDWCRDLWGKPTSYINSSTKRKAVSDSWVEKLAILDGRNTRRKKSSGSSLLIRGSNTKYGYSSTKHVLQPRTNISQSAPPSSSPTRDLPLHVETSATTLGHTINILYPSLAKTEVQHGHPEDDSQRPGLSRKRISYLDKSLVWLARASGESSKYLRRSLKDSIPHQQRLHFVESLLTGCGWYAGISPAAGVERGVIFVDDTDDEGKAWKQHAWKAIGERQMSLPEQPRKPILIFDYNAWCVSRDDVEGPTLWQIE